MVDLESDPKKDAFDNVQSRSWLVFLSSDLERTTTTTMMTTTTTAVQKAMSAYGIVTHITSVFHVFDFGNKEW